MTKLVMHPGKHTVTVPAVTREESVPDPKTGGTKLKTVVVEEARTEKFDLQRGSRFGNYVIGEVYEVSASEAATLAKRGFVEVSDRKAKKVAAESEDPVAANDRAAEEAREEAADKQRAFEPQSNEGGSV